MNCVHLVSQEIQCARELLKMTEKLVNYHESYHSPSSSCHHRHVEVKMSYYQAPILVAVSFHLNLLYGHELQYWLSLCHGNSQYHVPGATPPRSYPFHNVMVLQIQLWSPIAAYCHHQLSV